MRVLIKRNGNGSYQVITVINNQKKVLDKNCSLSSLQDYWSAINKHKDINIFFDTDNQKYYFSVYKVIDGVIDTTSYTDAKEVEFCEGALYV